MFSVKTGIQMYCVYRHVHLHHVHECLYLGLDLRWHYWVLYTSPLEIQDLESRMRLERIVDCVPSFAAHGIENIMKIQVNKTPVFAEGV
jgi:hypothetical protein